MKKDDLERLGAYYATQQFIFGDDEKIRLMQFADKIAHKHFIAGFNKRAKMIKDTLDD